METVWEHCKAKTLIRRGSYALRPPPLALFRVSLDQALVLPGVTEYCSLLATQSRGGVYK